MKFAKSRTLVQITGDINKDIDVWGKFHIVLHFWDYLGELLSDLQNLKTGILSGVPRMHCP